MANTPKNSTYKECEMPPMQVPGHIKVNETTPPPRVEPNVPNIIEDNNNYTTQPALKVVQQHDNGPHVIPQCNAAYAQQICTIPPYYVNAMYNEDTDKMEEYKQLIEVKHKDKWLQSFANELGCLVNGVGKHILQGTDAIKFIPLSQLPTTKTVTYGCIVCDICPPKEEIHCTHLMCGSDIIQYNGTVTTTTADITNAKILFNSVISTSGAKYLGLDIKDFYLNTNLDSLEFMHLPIALIPQEIIVWYNLMPLVHNDFVCIEISKGMYDLP
eukprot:9796265-Ditylum_brightwellii.AAC.1